MTDPAPVRFFFNFRSPYCYLASKRAFDYVDRFHVELLWRPLGGWAGRSPPERAKRKIPLVRQDVQRFTRRMGIPFVPPPKTTDPTHAGRGSLFAEEQGLLRPYVVEVMRAEWAEGKDIGEPEVLAEVARRIGLDEAGLAEAIQSEARQAQLDENAEEAERLGAIGVPTWIVGEDIFWGNDRIDFLEEHLTALRLRRL